MLSRAKGHAARIAMTLAASVLALASSIVALPQPAAHAEKPHGERLNKKYAVADTDYPVPQSNVLWVSPEGDEDSEADDEVETVKATSMMPSDIWIDILTLIAPST